MSLAKNVLVTPPDLSGWPNFHIEIVTVISGDGIDPITTRERTAGRVAPDQSWKFSEPDPGAKVDANERAKLSAVVATATKQYGAPQS